MIVNFLLSLSTRSGKEIKPVALSIVKLCLVGGISQLAENPVN